MLNDDERVAVTGLGVVAPAAVGVAAFRTLLREGRSGVRADARLAQLQFLCRVSGRCSVDDTTLSDVMNPLERRRLRSAGIRYALVAGGEALRRCGLDLQGQVPDPRRSVVFGGAIPGIDVLRDAFALTDSGRSKRLGSATVEMQMPSTSAALLAARLRAGGQVTCNSAACATGVEALLTGWQRIRSGVADVVLVGSTESEGAHLWSAFDALHVLSRKHNDEPERASRPLSASAGGFVPASGAGALVLERWSHAVRRHAPIVCEVLGGAMNNGAQLQGGSMTAQNPHAALDCVRQALHAARIEAAQVDAISGHLTATQGDVAEVTCWAKALQRTGTRFPWLNAPKSLWGHALTASASIELVACALQLADGFVHASLNCEDLHPTIGELVDPARIVTSMTELDSLRVLAKTSFGFGDVNGCAILSAVPIGSA